MINLAGQIFTIWMLMPDNFDTFSKEAQAIAHQVIEVASRYQHNHLDLEHVLLALLETPDTDIDRIFALLKIEKGELASELELTLTSMPVGDENQVKAYQFTIDERMKNVIEQAPHEANRLWSKAVKPVHLLIAAVNLYDQSEKQTAFGIFLAMTGITPERIRKVAWLLN
jgi:ATP-dependent Clp protease ATP-binding subunit ClpB